MKKIVKEYMDLDFNNYKHGHVCVEEIFDEDWKKVLACVVRVNGVREATRGTRFEALLESGLPAEIIEFILTH